MTKLHEALFNRLYEPSVKLAALPITRTHDRSRRFYETLSYLDYINKIYGLSEAERMYTVLTARNPEDVLTKEELRDMLRKATL